MASAASRKHHRDAGEVDIDLPLTGTPGVECQVGTYEIMGVKHFCLFHHNPDHNDDKLVAMVSEAEARVAKAGSSMIVSAARERAEITL